ncbi:Hpt domain-containing protein [Comamonas sp. NLF-1-9]|uniref:Hpt domain-containing protein n=1 Tax=Comamonas sp. NLF-1-9 TaxID=2853163 RepID=UPI001C462D71|nr:Hpt domain-containing protein [Comamonas sp. NLF-1-9]QXL84427.1 Hpt domain-containing protein [Comamonas sp. NLF-1-9]
MSPTGASHAAVRDVRYEEQDLGPLAWVHAELRKMLDGAVKQLRHFAHEIESSGESDLASHDITPLRNVRLTLHQCTGALVMVGMEQTALVLQAMEAALQRLIQQPELCRNEAVSVLEGASFAVIEYLDSILAGKSTSPVALFPQYRQVQQLAGVPHVHPMDLWPAERRMREPVFPGSVLPLPYSHEVRTHLDSAVLRIVKNGDVDAAMDMQHLCMGFAAAQQQTRPRLFWKAAAGFFEAIGRRWLPVDAYVKRTTSRVLMQYTVLARGDTTLAERLLPELLFFCAQARMPEDATGVTALRSVRHAWDLQRSAPVDYESPRFGLCDPALLAQARKRIAAATETWSALAGGDKHKIKLAADQFSLVCDSLRKLQLDSEPLAEALMRAVAVPLHSAQPPAPALAMEVATSVLYLQAAFEELDAAREHMAERGSRLAGRLDGVTLGGESQPLEPWMEELYRRVSDQQTMGSVVGELRVTLADVEKSLDQYFRKPEDTAVLGPVPGGMQQMRGVLSVLGLEQASLAVLRMRDLIEQLMLNEVPAQEQPRVVERLGNSLGALGFLVDMLGYQRAMAAKLFVYDEELGELKIVMGSTARTRVEDSQDEAEQLLAARASDAPEFEVDPQLLAPAEAPAPQAPQAAPPQVPDTPSAEAPGEAPSAPALLDLDLPTLDLDGPADTAADEPAPPVRAADEAPAHADLAAPQQAAAAEEGASEPAAAEPEQAQIDEELLEIFIEEAREVIANGLAAVQALHEQPGDIEEQTTLRRAFHTLKGSSRMVGLQEFGEAAWAMEQVLNDWLVHEKPASVALRTLCHDALQAFAAWIQDLAQGDARAWNAADFQQAAEAMRVEGVLRPWAHAGAAAGTVAARADADDATGVTAPLPLQPAAPHEAGESAHDSGFGFADTLIESPLNAAAEAPSVPGPAEPAEQSALLPEDIFVPAPEAPVEADAPAAESNAEPEPGPETEPEPTELAPALPGIVDGDFKEVGHLRVPTALYNVYLSEAEEWSGRLVAQVQGWAAAASPTVSEEAVAMAHSLAGSSATVGFADLSGLARTLEHALQHLQLLGHVPAEHLATLGEAVDEIRRLLHQFAAGFLKQPQPAVLQQLDALLQTDISSGSQSLAAQTPQDDAALEETLINRLQEWRDSQIGTLSAPSEPEAPAQPEPSAESEAPMLIEPEAEPEVEPESAPEADAQAMPEQGQLPEAPPDVATAPQSASHGDDKTAAATDISAPAPLAADGVSDDPFQHDQEIDRAIAQAIAADTDEDEIDVIDTIDPDLFPIFEEEAQELLPTLGGALRQWLAQPSDMAARSELLRALHTLKGSARLAGALRLGEMAHRMESAVEGVDAETATAADIDPLMTRFDGLQATFDALRAMGQEPAALEQPDSAAASDAPESAVGADDTAGAAKPLVAQAAVVRPVELVRGAARTGGGQQVRVRSQLLDRMVNDVGEVLIARSRLSTRVLQMRGSLDDLSGNLERLRAQLRDIEVQAESQMQSRQAQSRESAAAFDPLEFDRFTRMQELTRMMAESVNDVATVQRALQRSVEGAEDDLTAQGRQARELQRELLRTRMVEFDSLSERLYAVVRQASRETGKQVRLDIVGGTIEMDRGVLERMAPAFEHLLRNCVGHGIEPAAAREAAGKPLAGTIVVTAGYEGNDVSVEFRDDGAGLDVERIRARALAQGLIAPDEAIDVQRAAELIFQPGFSTAAEVTELAGRGIGMDVVRTEVQSLGGRIETTSTAGQGTAFRMVLPLTTAVTQVVMVRLGKLSIGIPANIIEVVRRASSEELEQAYTAGAYLEAPLYWAGALLQASAGSTQAAEKTRPVVIVRSASQRLALHVDEVLGNQEVVVKNLGPQLSTLPGLAGMSVLASGAVVLIYNPVALATVYGEQARAVMRSPEALRGKTAPAQALPGATALQSTAAVPLVLVVDDSITVRRVTQRLLQREGYRVALAADGLQALQRLREERPVVVLSDIEMPRMDGFDLARAIRADDKLADLPIIMITSRMAEKHKEHAVALGVSHYLGKPYSDEVLLGLVQRYAEMEQAAAQD